MTSIAAEAMTHPIAAGSMPSSATRVTRSAKLSPLACHNLGYMLISVNPGIVLISFR